MPDKIHSTTCIVVTFNPHIEQLSHAVKSISHSTGDIIIVDNNSNNLPHIRKIAHNTPGISLVEMPINAGIAAAQNRGIELAISNGATHIWLSDQDTIYPDNYLDSMFDCLNQASNESPYTIGAIGPAFLDTNTGDVQPFSIFKPFTKSFIPKPGINFVSQIIASGAIISTQALKTVGLKQENLFIDWVDVEWCWRAEKTHNLKIIGCGNTLITHTLGDDYVNFLGKKLSFRSPFRHYFIVRNAIALAFHSSSPTVAQRIEITLKAILRAVAYPLIAPSNKIEHLRATLSGLVHGALNKLGPKV